MLEFRRINWKGDKPFKIMIEKFKKYIQVLVGCDTYFIEKLSMVCIDGIEVEYERILLEDYRTPYCTMKSPIVVYKKDLEEFLSIVKHYDEKE